MQLVLGLGNPGRAYRDNRHNVGHRCVARLAAELGLGFEQETAEYREAAGEGPAGELSLIQPLTYMNRSGEALLAWSRRHGLSVGGAPPPSAGEGSAAGEESEAAATPPPDVVPVVVCDDIHLPLGSIRIRAQGSDGGQNGLASVIAICGPAVPRLRLGVGPREGSVPPEAWADYVLEDFSADEEEAVEDLVRAAATALTDLLVLGPEQAGSRHNRRIRSADDLPGAD